MFDYFIQFKLGLSGSSMERKIECLLRIGVVYRGRIMRVILTLEVGNGLIIHFGVLRIW